MSLSFYSLDDSLALANSVERVLELGGTLDGIDASLQQASGGETANNVNMSWLANDDSSVYVTLAQSGQHLLEYHFSRRDGADGEWFRRVIAKRRELLDALISALAEMERAHQKSLWMVARQQERGTGDEVELIESESMRDEVQALTRSVSALTEGVGEVHLGPITRL
jgi:hypothetical protein